MRRTNIQHAGARRHHGVALPVCALIVALIALGGVIALAVSLI